jgi:hypothetical protein
MTQIVSAPVSDVGRFNALRFFASIKKSKGYRKTGYSFDLLISLRLSSG